MAALPQWIEARVIQKIATEAEWNEITLVPYKGEVCLVGDSGGKVVNIKIGDGINTFPNLEYMFDSIQQNVGYIAIESNALPTPLDDVAWGMVTGGTYTFGGVDVFTVPDGHWGIANYSSSAWSLVDMGELPVPDVSGFTEKGGYEGTSKDLDDRIYEIETSPSEAKDWSAGTYTEEQTAVKDGVLYRVKPSVSSTTGEPGISADWEPIGKNVDVVDNVNSESTTEALSANQGKLLNEKITTVGNIIGTITEIDTVISNNNNIIASDGATSSAGGFNIRYTTVVEGDKHKIESQLPTSANKRAWGYYSALPINSSNFISGGEASTASPLNTDEYVTAPTGATILAVSSYSSNPAKVSDVDARLLKDVKTIQNQLNTFATTAEIEEIEDSLGDVEAKLSGVKFLFDSELSLNDTTLQGLNRAFKDADIYSDIPSGFRIRTLPSKSQVEAGITTAQIGFRGSDTNFSTNPVDVPPGGVGAIELVVNHALFKGKFLVDFSELLNETPVSNNNAPYYFDVDQLQVIDELKPLSKFAGENQRDLNIKTNKSIIQFPSKPIRNIIDNQFLNPIALYSDLSSTVVVDNNNTLNYRVRHALTGTLIQDDNVGEGLQFSIPFNSETEAFNFSGIKQNAEILIGIKIPSSQRYTLVMLLGNGGGGTTRYYFDGRPKSNNNNTYSDANIIHEYDGYYIWKINVTGYSPDITASSTVSIKFLDASSSSGTYTVSIFNPIVASKITTPLINMLPARSDGSPFLGKNLMFFADSNGKVSNARAFQEYLGCTVYWNAAGGRSMRYRGVGESEFDLGWLYHWDRRSFLQQLSDEGKPIDAFVFNVSYNDTSGGGTLSDAAIQAVLDNYPVIGDDSTTVANKLSLWNAMSIPDRVNTFHFKQTYAAYLQQIIELFPTAKIFLCTVLYSPAINNVVNDQREYDKPIRDSINADIRDIAAWFGIPVIDTNSSAGYYYGNMVEQGTTDTIHFSEDIGYRIGYYTAKRILDYAR